MIAAPSRPFRRNKFICARLLASLHEDHVVPCAVSPLIDDKNNWNLSLPESGRAVTSVSIANALEILAGAAISAPPLFWRARCRLPFLPLIPSSFSRQRPFLIWRILIVAGAQYFLDVFQISIFEPVLCGAIYLFRSLNNYNRANIKIYFNKEGPPLT